MTRTLALLCLLAFSIPSWSHELKGQVLKPADGETLLGGMIVLKATPANGTGGGEMMIATLTPGFSTRLHKHTHADEFFFVHSGAGFVVVGSKEVAVSPGDSIFIPRGLNHQLKNLDAKNPLVLVAFLDRPGLADNFRQMHKEQQEAASVKPATGSSK